MRSSCWRLRTRRSTERDRRGRMTTRKNYTSKSSRKTIRSMSFSKKSNRRKLMRSKGLKCWLRWRSIRCKKLSMNCTWRTNSMPVCLKTKFARLKTTIKAWAIGLQNKATGVNPIWRNNTITLPQNICLCLCPQTRTWTQNLWLQWIEWTRDPFILKTTYCAEMSLSSCLWFAFSARRPWRIQSWCFAYSVIPWEHSALTAEELADIAVHLMILITINTP